MTWTNWSQTWTTTSRMTTSRKPQKCSSKTMRSIRMYLLLQADQRPKQNHKDVLSASSSTKTILIGERIWTDVEPEDYSPVDFPVSKQLSTLLRHGSLPREDDGAIEFWRIKDYLQNPFVHSRHWSDEKWKSTMAKGGGNKKRFQCSTDPSGQEILHLRALEGHSGRNLFDLTLQDNVFIPNDFFEYIYHIGCAINLHSIVNSGLILGGQKFEQKTDGILHVCGSNEQRTEIRMLSRRSSWWNLEKLSTRK